MLKIIFRYTFWFILAVFLLLGLIILLIQFPFIQNRLVHQVTKELSKSLNTEVSVGSVSIDILSRIHVNSFLVRDYKKDTLLYAGSFSNSHVLDFSLDKPFQLVGQNIRLSNVKFYLDNTVEDSIFNLTKTFNNTPKVGSESKSKSQSASKKPNLSFIRLGKLNLENVSFRLRDKYNYQTISFHVSELDLDASRFKFSDSSWNLSSLEIVKPSVSIIQHPAPYSPKNYKPEYLKLPFQLHLDKLAIEDGSLIIKNETEVNTIANKINFSDLHIKNVYLESENVDLKYHSFKGKVNHFRALEKSGLGIVDLQTNFFMNSYKMEAKNLLFKTNHSKIKGYLRFNYNHMREYLRFAEWVKVTGDVFESNISLKDLSYFSPNLKSLNHLDVKFTTIARGTMNKLNLTHLTGSLNENKIRFNGDIKVEDLFSGRGLQTIANLDNFSFDKNDIEFIFQKKDLPNEVSRLGTMTYDGEFKGNPTKFVLNGQLNSNHGTSILRETSFDFTQPKSPKYQGNVKIHNLQLSKIIAGETPIDNLSAEVFINGQGFNIESLNTYIKGVVSSVTINEKDYSNFQIDGNLQNKIFTGDINSSDPTLSFNANGNVSMQDEVPKLELQVNLQNVDLFKLGYSKKKLHLYANLYGIGRGKNLDEMLGTMNVKDMFIIDRVKDNKMYSFSNLTVEKDVFEESGNKYIQINSDEFKASLIGQFNLTDMPSLLKDYFLSYLAIDKNKVSKKSYESTYFNLNMDIQNIRNYTLVLHPALKNIRSGKLFARFNGMENRMTMDGDFNQTEYLGFKFPHLSLTNASSNTDFQCLLRIDSVYFDNKLAITPLKANLLQSKDGINLALELLNRTDDKFVDFNCVIKKEDNNYLFHIKPFSSHFGRKVWSIHPDNLIRLNKNEGILQCENLELYKDIQTIRIENKSNDLTSIQSKFEEVKLEELISGFLPILKTFKGNLNGTIEVSDVLSNPKPVANLDVKDMMWDNEFIGDLKLSSDLNNEIVNSILTIKGKSYDLKSDIYYNARTGIDSLYSTHKIEKFNLGILNKLLSGLIYNMDGNARGDFSIFGPLNALNSKGAVIIDSLKTGLHTIYTSYSARNQLIRIVPGKFELNNFTFSDEEGNIGTASGFINYNNLKKYDLFLDAFTSKLLCMNSNSTNNNTIYGKVYAEAEFKFRGTIGERISIISKGRNLPNSVLYINLESTQKTGKYGFYDFISKDSGQSKINQLVVGKARKLSGVNLDFDFDVNRDGKLFIIMDPSIEDRIECNGQGRIAFKLTPETDLDIKGSYEIFSGTYLFTYQNVVQRLFYLNKGGSLTFIGDPKASLIDASATFTTRASAQELISAYFGNTDNSRIISAAKSNVKTDIILKLKNQMVKPDISYELKVDQNNPEVSIAFEAIESTTKNNEAEMNKQVMGLLMFRRFFPPTFTGFSQNQNPNNAVRSDLANTASDLLTGKISSIISGWIQNNFKDLNFGISHKMYNQLNQTDNLSNTRNEFKIAVSQRLLNDRLVFNLGGNYDFGGGQFSNTNTAFFGGDVDIEYLLSPLGNVRAKFYSTLSNDPLNSVYINKTGAGILIQKDFDDFNQLFKKNRLK